MALFKLFVCLSVLYLSADAVEYQIRNNDVSAVWIGVQENPGHAHFKNGGFILDARQDVIFYTPDNWAGRFWTRVMCDEMTSHCFTGDCGNLECSGRSSRATLAEINLRGYDGFDFYDFPSTGRFNKKVSIKPLGVRAIGNGYSWKREVCDSVVSNSCPGELHVRRTKEYTIGRRSACYTDFPDDAPRFSVDF